MLRVLFIAAASLVVSSAAHAAPGSAFGRLSASSDQASSESKTESSGLLTEIMSFLRLSGSVKGVAAAAPTPTEPSPSSSGAIKECEEEEIAGKSSKKKEDEKLAKQTGPEPIYLAF